MPNFSTFEAARRAAVFPELEAENLVASHQRWVIDALIDLQLKVECLQQNQLTRVPMCATFYHCGASVFCAPRGYIQKLYTVTDDDGCTQVEYEPISKTEFDCLLKNLTSCATILHGYGYYPDSQGAYHDNPTITVPGIEFSDETLDKPCRATKGYFTLHRENLYVFPSMQWNEIAIVEWDGIKRTFASDDSLPVKYDREIERAVELYLEAESARKDDENQFRFTTALAAYNNKVGDLIWNCTKELRLPRRGACFVNCC